MARLGREARRKGNEEEQVPVRARGRQKQGLKAGRAELREGTRAEQPGKGGADKAAE